MYDKEKKQSSYLTLLLCYTFFLGILTVEAIMLGWDMKTVIYLLAGLVACWVVHVNPQVSEKVKKWLYILMSMAAFVFYGSHETSFYDMAPVMIGVMMIYFAAGIYDIFNLCIVVYAATMLYVMIFVLDGLEFTPLTVSRILLHFTIVVVMARLAKLIVGRQTRERMEIDARIQKLEETNQRTEDFLTNVSHELRTPINAVTGLAAVMLKNEDSPKKRENLLSVQRAGHRLFRQVEDILDFTEIDTGRVTVSEEDYMISSLINDMIAENNLMEDGKKLELIFDVDAEIPAMLHGDARKIRKIIKHLMDNAVKFTDKGGVCVRIYALKKPYGINLCIKVSDTGVGMDQESLEKMSEKFYQSSGGRARKAGGLGLGIPIVYGMAAVMEGFVHVESREGSGTTVMVSIPQKVVDPAKCMEVGDPRKFCLACYLKPEKYQVPEVRRFYDETISHIACGLDITVHRVFNLDELESLTSVYRLTHLFLAKEEYEENPEWFENLDREIQVVVVADADYTLPRGSRMKFMAKPFCCFPVLYVLNTEGTDEAEGKDRRMICPDTRVLVVDDEPMNRMVAEGIFLDYRMKVKTAGSGPEAIEIMGREDFDLVFLDHMMPKMDGVETLKHLRRLKTDSGQPFMAIAFTANAVSGAREMFFREGFDEFLPKPVEYLELERVLRKVLPKSQIRYADEQEEAPENVETEQGETVREQPEQPKQSEQPEQKPKAAGELAPFEELGVHTSEGLSYCRGDKNFYLKMLAMYGQESEQKSAEIESLYGQKDYENYRIQVHALKSTSRLLGADSVFEMAKDVEAAAKNGDTAYIDSHHEELIAAYRDLGRQFREILGLEEEPAAETGEGQGEDVPSLSDEVFLEQLEELQKSLDTYESEKAQHLMEGMEKAVWRGSAVKELLREVGQAVEQFEFETASEKLAALAGRVKEGGV